MGQTTTYRAAFRFHGDIAATMVKFVANLPLSRAQPTNFGDYNVPAFLAKNVAFSGRIPQDDLDEPYWLVADDRLVFAADLLNPQYRDDDSPKCEIGEPSRRSRILDALSELCAETDGAVIGGWQNENADDWNPLLVHAGRVVTAYGAGASLDDHVCKQYNR